MESLNIHSRSKRVSVRCRWDSETAYWIFSRNVYPAWLLFLTAFKRSSELRNNTTSVRSCAFGSRCFQLYFDRIGTVLRHSLIREDNPSYSPACRRGWCEADAHSRGCSLLHNLRAQFLRSTGTLCKIRGRRAPFLACVQTGWSLARV